MRIVVGLNGLCFGTLFAMCPKLGLFMSKDRIVYSSCNEPPVNVLLLVAEMIGNVGTYILDMMGTLLSR